MLVRILVGSLLAAAGAAAQEAGDRTPIRSVTASPSQPIVIFTRVRTVTTIRLPEGEEILHTVAGDGPNWDLTARGREINVKPLVAGSVSNVTVSCASGAVYTFTVVEDAEALTDYVVTVDVEPEDPVILPVEPGAVDVRYRPASLVGGFRERLDAYRTRRDRILEEGRIEVDRLWADAERRQDRFAERFAQRVRLPYLVTEEAYGVPFLLRDLWTDGTFTYLRTEGQEIPAVYAWRAGSSALVHADVEPDGLIVVDQVIRHGTLSLGGEEAWFGLASEGGRMPQRRAGFFDRNFAAPPRMYFTWGAVAGVLAAVWGR